MKVTGKQQAVVEIDPKDVINKLLRDEIGEEGSVEEVNVGYYLITEEYAGPHIWTNSTQITRERFEYIQSLQLVLSNLEKDAESGR